MSASSIQREIESIQREIERLHRDIASESTKEADKSSRIARAQEALGRASNASAAQSKAKEIQGLEKERAAIQKRRADIAKRLADKTQELNRKQAALFKEQTREQTDAIKLLERNLARARDSRELDFRRAFALPTSGPSEPAQVRARTYDAFVSHATEDKEEVVRPLADQLVAMGFSIWYDETQLTVGDSLRRSIDTGLARSRYGIVILSPSFFSKNWPQYELDGLVAKEMDGRKVILPLWHKVTKDEVLGYSPSLADRVALNTAMYSTVELATELAQVLRA